VSEEIPWLTVSPRGASSPGPPQRIAVSYDTSGLAAGSHAGEILVTSTNASNSPQALAVLVQVVPRACFREPFSYYDGDLTTMGSAGWSGTATNQIVVEDGALKILGGGGAASATCPVSCAGSNGIIAVHMKIRRGAGTGDFFWNIAIDDDSGDPAAGNLGRWYGGSSTARGRIGGEVTSDMELSGSGDWDQLLMKIDTASDTSEFLLNGVSHGVLSHGSGPTDNVGAIRIERFDRVGADCHSIFFDDFIIESAALRAFHRGDADSSGTIGISDAIAILGFLFRGGAAPGCAESADWDNDGSIDIADGLRVLFFLFAGGPPPPAPGPPGAPCGADPDAPGSKGDLGCGAYDRC